MVSILERVDCTYNCWHPTIVGGVTRKLGDWVGKLGITLQTAFVQKTALLGTTRILRKVEEIVWNPWL